MRRPALSAVVAPLAALLAPPAFGLGFVINDDVRAAWNNVIAVGAGVRMHNPDAALIGFNNANQYPGAKSPVAVADDGNLNYRKGDVVSAPVSWLPYWLLWSRRADSAISC